MPTASRLVRQNDLEDSPLGARRGRRYPFFLRGPVPYPWLALDEPAGMDLQGLATAYSPPLQPQAKTAKGQGSGHQGEPGVWLEAPGSSMDRMSTWGMGGGGYRLQHLHCLGFREYLSSTMTCSGQIRLGIEPDLSSPFNVEEYEIEWAPCDAAIGEWTLAG